MSIGWNLRFCVLRRVRTQVSLWRTPSIKYSATPSFENFTKQNARQEGFTLIEVVASISLMGILMAMSIGALTFYLSNRSLDTAVTEITAQIREAQTLAVATGNSYRIDFSDPSNSSYTLQRRSGSDWVIVKSVVRLPDGVTFNAASLPDFGGDRYLKFDARGTAESGQLNLIGRFGKTRNLNVDGVTANVW